MIETNIKKPKVLIVDDVKENIHAIMINLREQCATLAATNGEKALELASIQPQPDLILLDIMMPDMDGYEVLRRLKSNPATTDIPVIFVTSLSESEDEAKGLKMGAADYITKPINPDLLKVRILTQIELHNYQKKQAAFCISNSLRHEQPCLLIVDDVPENIHGLISALSGEYRIMVANKGRKAIELALGASPPDLILLDIVMPGMDGYEVCRHIKASEAGNRIPIIFLTVLDESVDKVRGLSIGGGDFVTKPFDIDEVRARIGTHLELSRYRNHLEKLVQDAAVQLELKSVEILKLSLVVDQSPDSIIITDIEGRIEYVNNAFVEHTGYSREEAIGQNPRFMQSGKTPLSVFDDLWATLTKGQPWRGEFINRRKGGGEVIESAIIAPIRQSDGRVINYVCVEQDVTSLRNAEATIQHLTNFDYLTGLPNKTLLMDRLGLTLAAALRKSSFSALIMLDIDRFKNLNEAGGHDLGDAILIAFSKRIAGLLREEDTMARQSADQFAVLLHDLGKDLEQASQKAINVISKIQANLRTPFIFSGNDKVSVTACLGVALFPEADDDSVQNILRRADIALHRAKDAGGSHISFFDNAMTASAENRFRIERELRTAIPNGELRLFLQPQVNSEGHRVGAEVLVRWQHPERGLLVPIVFIPVAEETDLIVELGVWVMTESCRLIAQEEQSGAPLDLAVNISPRHFRKPEFVPWIKQLIATTGVAPYRLTFEITENLFINDINDAVCKMIELNSLGFHFSIDDFGTGYSSLAYLKRLPIHELKIDKSFINDVPTDADDVALVETILAVAKHMRLKVVAEGVETEEQAAFLNARGQVIHQGYFFGRPEPADDWIDRWHQHPHDPQSTSF
jgi:diguanylate cyclase (GGDEF)-like protein/PAS domain S-box-containing protein